MNGNNQYRAEKHGLQDAIKGSRFLKFPDVLQLQLKRFEYDPFEDKMVKVFLFITIFVYLRFMIDLNFLLN